MANTEKRPVPPMFRLPRGIAIWPYLSAPDFKFKTTGEFKAELAIPKDTTEKVAEAVISDDGLSYVKVGGKIQWRPITMGELLEKLQAIQEAHVSKSQKDYDKSRAEAKKRGKKDPGDMKVNDLPFFETGSEAEEHPDCLRFKLKLNHRIEVKSGKNAGKTMELWPALFDAKGEKFEPKKQKPIGGGSVLKASFEVFPYVSPAGVGIQLRIKGIQVLELKQFSGGATAEDSGFEAEEGFDSSESQVEEKDAEDVSDGDDLGSETPPKGADF
jgi:hypothetical protein